MKNNVLIAEYMGKRFYPYKENSSFDISFTTYDACMEWIKEHKKDGYIPQLDFKCENGLYNVSWDWLMPVYYKVRKFLDENSTSELIMDKFKVFQINIGNAILYKTISEACEEIAKFIKWYNEKVKPDGEISL